jgi:hypothetical protein
VPLIRGWIDYSQRLQAWFTKKRLRCKKVSLGMKIDLDTFWKNPDRIRARRCGAFRSFANSKFRTLEKSKVGTVIDCKIVLGGMEIEWLQSTLY